MKKRIVALLTVALAAVFSLALVGCGGNNDAKFLGHWKLVGGESSGEALTQEDIEFLDALGLSITLDLNDDHTAVLSMMGEDIKGDWEATSSSEGKITLEELGSGTLKIDGEQLILTDSSGEALEFAKSDEAPAKPEGNSDAKPAPAPAPAPSTSGMITEKGYPSLLAMTSLPGADMVALLQDNGYSWDSQIEGFANANIDHFSYNRADSAVNEADSKKVPAGGGADSFIIFVYDGYKTADLAADALAAGITIDEKDYDAESNVCFLAFAAPDGTFFTGFVEVDSHEIARLYLFSQASVEAGLADKVLEG